MPKHFKILFTLVTTFFAMQTIAQVSVDQTMTPEELVQEVLLGEGIEAWNITFNGQPGNILNNQIGRYNGPSALVDFDDGIALVSGDVIQIEGQLGSSPNPNIIGDPDLLALANVGGTNFNVRNCAILEFDFIPTGDLLEVKFVFMSYEYPSFTCSNYNDPFGFFISGPGIDGPFTNNAMNIALIPGTDTPISVNTINAGFASGFSSNANCLNANPNFVEDSQYFIDNNPPLANDINFPGMTVSITAYAEVVCGETYHIKLAVADATDASLDSGVLIEASSFQPNLYIDTALDIPVGVNDSTLYGGCGSAQLTFTRPGDTSLVETIYLEYSGDAVNGVHYSLLPDSLVFEAGVSSITLDLVVPPGADITEPLQAIISITNIASNCFGSVLTSEYEFWVNAVSPLDAIFNDVDIAACGDNVTFGPIPVDGYGAYTFEWSDGFEGPEQTLSPLETVTYTITVSDTCGMQSVTGNITVNVPEAPPVFVDAGEDQYIEFCYDIASLEGLIEGGDENYSFEWYNGDELISTDQVFQYTPMGTTVISFVGTDACGNSDSDELTLFVQPADLFVYAGPELYLENCFDSILVSSTAEGGAGPPPEIWTITVWSNSWGDATTWNIQDAYGDTIAIGGAYGNGYTDTQTFSGVDEPLTFNITSTLGDNNPNFLISCNDEVLSGSIPGNSSQSFPDLTCVNVEPEFSYVWSLPNGEVIGSEESIWFSSPEGTYLTVSVTDACGNTGSDTVSVIYDVPELTYVINPDTSVCVGIATGLWIEVNGGVPPYHYDWSHSTENNSHVYAQTTESATYSVLVTDQCNGIIMGETTVLIVNQNSDGSPCEAIIDDYTIDIKTDESDSLQTSITELQPPNLNVFPNPGHGQFVITLAGVTGTGVMRVLDVTGRTIIHRDIELNGDFRADIALHVARGTYLLQIATSAGDFKRTIKVI